MPKKPSTRIGEGAPAVVLEEVLRRFSGMTAIYRGDDIRTPTDWSIYDDRHSVVVHLGGRMDRLETEMDGFGGSTGAALPGEVWTVPAQRHYASHASGGSIEYLVLKIAPEAHDTLSGTTHGRLDLKPVAGHRDDFLHHAARQLIHAMQAQDDLSRMLAESLAQTLCLHIMRTYASSGPTLPSRKNEAGPTLSAQTSQTLRDSIQSRLDSRITLADLASLAGMTTHQFLQAFRKAFGSTPGQYIIQQRLRQARQLLTGTRKDITTIALECGFSSHSHLTATFTKELRCSPKAYREQTTTLRKTTGLRPLL